MTLVNDDEVEEVRRILAEIRRRRTIFSRWSAHERLENGKEEAAVLRHFSFLLNVFRPDSNQRILGDGRERVVSLIRKDVSIGKNQNSRTARCLACQVPAAMK